LTQGKNGELRHRCVGEMSEIILEGEHQEKAIFMKEVREVRTNFRLNKRKRTQAGASGQRKAIIF